MALDAMAVLLAEKFGWDALALEAHFAGLAAQTLTPMAGAVSSLAEFGTLGMVSVSLMSLPVYGVFSALGAGYYEARELVADENVKSGLSQGFVAGIVALSFRTAWFLFGRHGMINISHMDEQTNVIRVNAFNRGFLAGYCFGSLFPPQVKKVLLQNLRTLAGHPSAGNWSDQNKISFVISLATALRYKWQLA